MQRGMWWGDTNPNGYITRGGGGESAYHKGLGWGMRNGPGTGHAFLGGMDAKRVDMVFTTKSSNWKETVR